MLSKDVFDNDKAFLHHVHIAVANHKGPKNIFYSDLFFFRFQDIFLGVYMDLKPIMINASSFKSSTGLRQPPTAGFRRSSMGAKVGATLGATSSTTGKTNSSRPSAQNQDEIIAGPSSDTENRVFKYELRGKILNFEFTSEKRIKCALCGTQFKNILRHLQQSKCGLLNRDDLVEKFKEFTKDDANKRKADQNTWKAKSIAKQRKEDGQQFKDAQNKMKTKSRAKQREEDPLQVKEDQNRWKSNLS